MTDRTYPATGRPAPRDLAPNTAAVDPTADPTDARQQIEQLSDWLDTRFEIPLLRWRFGLDALVGLVPGVGDLATTLASVYIVVLASRCGMPRITLARMALNVAIDMLLGSLPIVGDLFDFWWKANRKNAALLRARWEQSPHDRRRGETADWLFVGALLAALAAVFAGVVVLTALIFRGLWHLLGL